MTEPLSISSNTSWTAYKLHDGFDAKILIVCVSLWLIEQRFRENPQDMHARSELGLSAAAWHCVYDSINKKHPSSDRTLSHGYLVAALQNHLQLLWLN